MTISTIFETSRPRGDVLRGAIAEADFAADLAQVVAGRGGAEYLDPARFFARTYPTRGLRNLLANLSQIVRRAERHVDAGEVRAHLNDRIREIFAGLRARPHAVEEGPDCDARATRRVPVRSGVAHPVG